MKAGLQHSTNIDDTDNGHVQGKQELIDENIDGRRDAQEGERDREFSQGNDEVL